MSTVQYVDLVKFIYIYAVNAAYSEEENLLNLIPQPRADLQPVDCIIAGCIAVVCLLLHRMKGKLK